ncbi:MAG: BrxA/BrxB family bacilliredoxin [Calditrichaceae bacterium]
MLTMRPGYPEELVRPMREELTSAGVKELKTPEEVEHMMTLEKGTMLMIINSVCGCAAGNARPAVKLSLNNEILPDKITTVFAGVDHDAVAKARTYILGYPPSSPSIALFENGRLLHMIPRQQIEGRMPEDIADELKSLFNTHCG